MKGWRDVPIDPHTRQLLRGSLTIDAGGTVVITLPHRLESPNKLLHAHWRDRTREKDAWKQRLLRVIADASGRTTVAGLARPIDALGLAPVLERRSVQVERRVPSPRNFIKDRDNLVYCVKPLLDQIKKLGFVRDDSSVWTSLEEPLQRVSPDGRDWTVVTITRLDPTIETLFPSPTQPRTS